MKRNLYNFKLRGSSGGGIGIGGIGIGNPAGEGIGIVGAVGGDLAPDGYQFYNVKMDRVLYYLACSNGDTLGSVNDHDFRAYNVS